MIWDFKWNPKHYTINCEKQCKKNGNQKQKQFKSPKKKQIFCVQSRSIHNTITDKGLAIIIARH